LLARAMGFRKGEGKRKQVWGLKMTREAPRLKILKTENGGRPPFTIPNTRN